MIEARIPGRVWHDALDPMATEMEDNLGLPRAQVVKKGRGMTFVYELTGEQAIDLADYLQERATTLGGQYGIDQADRELYRTMHSVGHRLRRSVLEAGQRATR